MADIKFNNIQGVIFDLDGTILDSMHIWSEIGLKFLKLKSAPYTRALFVYCDKTLLYRGH